MKIEIDIKETIYTYFNRLNKDNRYNYRQVLNNCYYGGENYIIYLEPDLQEVITIFHRYSTILSKNIVKVITSDNKIQKELEKLLTSP